MCSYVPSSNSGKYIFSHVTMPRSSYNPINFLPDNKSPYNVKMGGAEHGFGRRLTLDEINLVVPVGSFFTLPPYYTNQHTAVLRVVKPFWMETRGNTNNLDWLYGSFDAHWPDGGFFHYPRFIVHDFSDINLVIDPRDETTLGVMALAGKSVSFKCFSCGRWRK